MTRRDILQAAGVGVVASVLPTTEAAQVQPAPIVDTHVHLWDLNRLRLPWIQKDSPLAPRVLLAANREQRS